MPMWDSCPRRRRRTDGGYTLFEVLVVIFIIGLIGAVAIPRLPLVSERVDYALKRESFEQTLNSLGYAAYRDNQSLVLGEVAADEKPDPDRLLKSRAVAGGPSPLPLIYETAPLPLPDGWVLHVDKPIVYSPSGFCSGGRATLSVGRLEYVYDLKAPHCAAVLAR